MANSADPDQLASSDLHCLQRQGISGFSRTRVKKDYLCQFNGYMYFKIGDKALYVKLFDIRYFHRVVNAPWKLLVTVKLFLDCYSALSFLHTILYTCSEMLKCEYGKGKL